MLAAAGCIVWGVPVSAQQHSDGASTSMDLVGRNGQFQIIHRDGAVENVDPSQLRLNRSVAYPVSPAAETTRRSSESQRVENGEGVQPAAGDKGAAPIEAKTPPDKTQSGSRPETDEEKAARQADAETLRKLRAAGGAYFYHDDNTPMSFEEVDKRIESGDVAGMKAIGLHLESWTPQSGREAEDADTEAASPPKTAR